MMMVAVLAVALGLLSYIPSLAWLSIIGFVMGIAVWVIARKMYVYNRANKRARASMVVGIVATVLGAAAVLMSFVIGSMLEGFMGMGSF